MISSRLLKIDIFLSLLWWRLAFWVFPFGWNARILRFILSSQRKNHSSQIGEAESLGKAVQELAWTIPAATCLTQAAVLVSLCARRGVQVELCLGVARDPDGSFHSHAWVSDLNGVLIGNRDLLKYQVIYRLGSI